MTDLVSRTLKASREALCLIDGNHTILWCNESFILLCDSKKPGQLSEVISEKSLRRVVTLNGSGLCEIEFSLSKLRDRRFFGLVLDLSEDDPSSEAKLIQFSMFAPQSFDLKEHEEFLTGVTHDLKNPLGAIFGYADVLLDTQVGTDINDKQRDIIARIRSTAARSVELVKNYQFLPMINRNTALMRKATTETAAICSVTQSVIDSTWRENKEAPKLTFFAVKPEPVVKISRIELERVIANLFSNALKFTPVDGQIIIKISTDKNQVTFSINNAPAFVAPAELVQLFTRYKRASNSRDISGSGLGLFVVKRLVEQAGGTVAATSTEKDGTTFVVTLPASSPVGA